MSDTHSDILCRCPFVSFETNDKLVGAQDHCDNRMSYFVSGDGGIIRRMIIF